MILINLLPHREERRKQRKRAFFVGLGLAAVAGMLISGVWYLALQQMTTAQQARNDFLSAEIKRLEGQIKDIATLKAEIDPEAWATLNSDTSRPFEKPKSGRIAVKVINHLGDEVMKVFKI